MPSFSIGIRHRTYCRLGHFSRLAAPLYGTRRRSDALLSHFLSFRVFLRSIILEGHGRSRGITFMTTPECGCEEILASPTKAPVVVDIYKNARTSPSPQKWRHDKYREMPSSSYSKYGPMGQSFAVYCRFNARAACLADDDRFIYSGPLEGYTRHAGFSLVCAPSSPYSIYAHYCFRLT